MSETAKDILARAKYSTDGLIPAVVQDAQRLADLAEGHAGRGVHVRHRADIWSGRVDACVDPELGVGLAVAVEGLTVQVQDQETV